MNLARKLLERFRSRLRRWHEREAAEVGCRRKALKSIAKKLGVSVVSLYRALNGYGNFQLKAEHYVLAIAHSMKPARRLPPLTLNITGKEKVRI